MFFSIKTSAFTVTFLCCVTLLGACSTGGQNEVTTKLEKPEPTLTEQWQLSGFDKPESVVYHAGSDAIYLTNINGGGSDKNGLGYIAKISSAGELEAQKWVDGLNAPKGMALLGESLFVADIDELLEISISEAKVVKRYTAAGSKFLNDVAVDTKGNIYVSDSATSRVYRLNNGKLDVWLSEDYISYPNGLYAEQDFLIVLTAAKGKQREDRYFQKVNYHTVDVSDFSSGESLGFLDGIHNDGSDNYFYSNWKSGALNYLKDGQSHLIKQHEQGAADFTFTTIGGKKLLLLPVMMPGKLIAYEVE